MPRPRLMKRPRRIIFKVDEEEFERLQAIAKEKGVTVSELLRRAVRQVIEGGVAPPAEAAKREAEGEDPVVLGVTRQVTVERMLQLIDRYIYDEISKAKVRAVLNGILELRDALRAPGAHSRLGELRASLRELREEYGELAREVRAQSVLRPLGEELLVLNDELGMPLFDRKGRKARS